VTERNVHAVYVISVFAELAGVHPQTLRNYERSGLLHPERTSGGSRRFSEEDLAALKHIQVLENRVAELRAQIDALADEARRTIEQTHRQYRRDLVPVQNAMAVTPQSKKRKAR
jgi:MerR family transcriptional regulator/heat shock protein HspR